MNRLNVGCGQFYERGWLNTDVVRRDNVEPDVLVDPHRISSLAWALADWEVVTGKNAGPFEQVYIGHVLEHIPWDDVPATLDEIAAQCETGAEVLVVGPDVYRILERWRAGEVREGLVRETLEDHGDYQHAGETWPEARHHWNCYGQRLVDVLTACPWAEEVEPVIPEDMMRAGWPLVSAADWQCAVLARVV